MEGIMKKKVLKCLAVTLVVLGLSLLIGQVVHAGSKSLAATKRNVYKDGSTESMRDVYTRRDAESKEYNRKMLSNSEESVRLLKEIRDLLRAQNTKK